MFHQRSRRPDHVQIRLFENDFLSGALPARLLAGLLRPADHDALTECVKAVHQNAPKAAAIRDQERDRGDAPHNPEHGKQTARDVALQRDPGLGNDLNQHAPNLKPQRARSFTKGSSVFL
ncbi:MAG TPA: hypothetical protein VNS62_06330, partial [Candidatus Udaeobacter sp.]|nr:hypothetical protein [Candidatus Udaeobacter sp.]